jgi:outer membrane receptor protein involved in Fe transport
MKRMILSLAILALVALPMFSQTSVNDSIQLKEVLVTGSKVETSRKLIPISVSQITRKNIENSGQLNILTALNTYVPSIFVTERNILGFGVSTGGSGLISIRGIGNSPNTGVLVLIDGHPQYQGIFGHPLSDAYVATDVEKVEIIRGPGSILYGSNAMGGVINILTRQNEKEGWSGNAGASYGSYNTQKYYGTLGYKKRKIRAYASVNHDQTDGIRANTDFNINNGYAKIGYELNRHFNLTADVSMAEFDANDNGSIYNPAPFHIDIKRGKTSFSAENKFSTFEGAFKMYHNFGIHDLSDGWHSTDRTSGLMFYQTLKLLPQNSITLGSDFKQFGGLANKGMAANQNKIVNEFALYGYTQQQLFEKLTLSAGLRWENNSNYGSEFIPMGGINYNPTATTTFKGSVSKGFRSPTIMETYLYAPNADLKPERLINYEISWLQSLLDAHLNIELTAYQAKGENMIQVVGVYPNVQRQNVGTFTNQGIEFSAKYLVSRNLFVCTNYNYLDLSTPIVAAPRQQINLSANYTYKKWNLNVAIQHIDKLYTSISPIHTTNYTLLNARLAAKPLSCFEAFIAGNNLLNQKYEITYGYPLAVANVSGGINYRF